MRLLRNISSSAKRMAGGSRFAEFDRVVNRTARLLEAHDVGKGDVVSLLMPNSARIHHRVFCLLETGRHSRAGKFIVESTGDFFRNFRFGG